MKIEHIVFFGLVWEPYHSLEVSGYSKYDKAGIDLGLWEFGGNTAEMEIARFTVINT